MKRICTNEIRDIKPVVPNDNLRNRITELPEVYGDKNLMKPFIDTTRLLAQKAFEFVKR